MATVVRRYNTTRNGQSGVVTEYDDGSESFSWSQETVSNVQTNSSGELSGAAETYVERKATVYKDTAESLAIKDSQDRLRAERAAYRETLKDMGYSGGEILRDPTMREYRELEKTYNADYLAARQVDQLGGSYKVTTDEFGNELSRETLSQAVPPEPRSPTYNYVNYPNNDPQISDQETVSSTSIPATPSYGPQSTSNVAPDDEIAIGFEEETIPTAAQLDSSNYAAEQQAAVEARLAERTAADDGSAMYDEDYGYYANPADDPNLWYDDSLGEYVPRNDRPEDWEARDQNAFVYDDNTGEWVPREDMPDNWNYDGEPAPIEYDGFGCIIGQEEYDDTDGICVPIGETSNYASSLAPDSKDEKVYDENGCTVGEEYYDWDNDSCVPFGPAEQAAWDNGCDVETEFWDDENFECVLKDSKKAPQPEPQPTLREARRAINKNDWRLRCRLSPFADYLYNNLDTSTSILQPLKQTDGVIFPYMPTVTIQNTANYSDYRLTHSNYRGYFYQGSAVENIIINADFTAQDTAEANYLLAVITFFKSCTKMFYGQDERRGVPPPLLYLTGLGEYQFNEHPCVLSYFNYMLPNDVDYIKCHADPMNYQTFGSQAEPLKGHSTQTNKLTRLLSSNLKFGSKPVIDNPIAADVKDLTKYRGGHTYVPTSIRLDLTFMPVNTRKQVSEEFSLDKFASGDLLKRGFW